MQVALSHEIENGKYILQVSPREYAVIGDALRLITTDEGAKSDGLTKESYGVQHFFVNSRKVTEQVTDVRGLTLKEGDSIDLICSNFKSENEMQVLKGWSALLELHAELLLSNYQESSAARTRKQRRDLHDGLIAENIVTFLCRFEDDVVKKDRLADQLSELENYM